MAIKSFCRQAGVNPAQVVRLPGGQRQGNDFRHLIGMKLLDGQLHGAKTVADADAAARAVANTIR